MLLLLWSIGAGEASADPTRNELAEKSGRPASEVATRAIDRMIDEGLHHRGVDPLPRTTDEQFARRIYLDVVGRIPTYAEVGAFLDSTDPQKRARLIDQLLDSPGYVSHMYNFWADILRVRDKDAGVSRVFYVNWIKEAIAENRPYDQFVRELVSSSGSGWQRGNGAVGYYFRDRGMPLDNMANTLRIFLGTRLSCAQCHDHPHDRWTRREFFEMAAFTSGVSTENKDKLFSSIYQREKVTTNPELRAFSQHVRNTFHMDRVDGFGEGVIEVPDDYQYDDASPGELITARTHMGPPSVHMSGETEAGYRYHFADWLTSPENPRFAQVIANRLWRRTMGVGLIEPVDDLKD
ncbi:DUF1549 domain-containing protein, partial [Pirellulales bacterium]|nr:DUF1549 domain-containing protein [Pirellulales bacterium]